MDIGDSKPTGKCETDRQNFKLTDDDDSAHQSGSPIAHMGNESSNNSSSSATSPDGMMVPRQNDGLGFVEEEGTHGTQ